MLAKWIGAQVKTTADGTYTSEDDASFSYLLKPEDLPGGEDLDEE